VVPDPVWVAADIAIYFAPAKTALFMTSFQGYRFETPSSTKQLKIGKNVTDLNSYKPSVQHQLHLLSLTGGG